ncbi:uncharacterized protein LOC144721041 [Lampetra planeri]
MERRVSVRLLQFFTALHVIASATAAVGTLSPITDDEEGDEDEEDREEEEQGCLWNQFQCGGGACVPRSWVCDWESDCSDGSDETSCRESALNTAPALYHQHHRQ